MGYTVEHITIATRRSSHNDDRDVNDAQAIENLRMEIEALIAGDRDYSRVVFDIRGG